MPEVRDLETVEADQLRITEMMTELTAMYQENLEILKAAGQPWPIPTADCGRPLGNCPYGPPLGVVPFAEVGPAEKAD